MPESMMDGRNTSCAAIVNFAWLFAASPSTLPIPSDATVYRASAGKKRKRLAGRAAPNSGGASISIMAVVSIRWINAEKAIVTSPKYTGTPFALYICFTSLPYVSSREGGSPISAPMETLITIIELISVLFISGTTEVKMPPIRRKKTSGTR